MVTVTHMQWQRENDQCEIKKKERNIPNPEHIDKSFKVFFCDGEGER